MRPEQEARFTLVNTSSRTSVFYRSRPGPTCARIGGGTAARDLLARDRPPRRRSCCRPCRKEDPSARPIIHARRPRSIFSSMTRRRSSSARRLRTSSFAAPSGLRRTRRLRQCVVLWRRQSAKPPRLQPRRDVAAFLRTGAVSLSVVVSGERLSQAANCLQLLVFDHCHASGPRVSRVANRMP
jgi:hypothetical protein